MSKLFVAVDLPLQTCVALGAIIPSPQTGLRVIPAEDLHLTLHYIGEAAVDRYASALAAVRAGSFDLSPASLGCFTHPKGQRILWMGVKPSEGLIHLHRKVADALATVGFSPELRPYTPHITLARARPPFSKADLGRILAQASAPLATVRITHFSLYSTQRTDDKPHYVRERTFTLAEQTTDG